MTERPILMSAPMVLACLREVDPKTQTRRVVKPQPHHGPVGAMVNLGGSDWAMDDGDLSGLWTCPYGVPGDALWVREGFRKLENASEHPSEPVWYMADGEPANGHWTGGKPSIHMPRWASRISLRVTNVRVERLNGISEADALAEGIADLASPDGARGVNIKVAGKVIGNWIAPRSRDVYETLWEHINGPGSWAANPWVWCVSFERIT